MIESNQTLEAHLARLNRSFELAGQAGVYLVSMGPGQPPCALSISPPVLVAQVHVGPVPRADDAASAQLMRRLLELNASGLLHAAFAFEADRIVLTAALELQNLDMNELEAVLADLDMALSEHVPSLAALSKSLAVQEPR
jgi:Tir chaperone family protein CesT